MIQLIGEMPHVLRGQEYLVVLIFACCTHLFTAVARPTRGGRSPLTATIRTQGDLLCLYSWRNMGSLWKQRTYPLTTYSTVKPILNGVFKYASRILNVTRKFLYLSKNKTEVDTVYQKLNEKISAHRPFGARG